MLKFVADRLAEIQGELEKGLGETEPDGSTLHSGINTLVGEIGGGINMTSALRATRDNFRDALDEATQFRAPSRHRSDDQRREAYRRTLATLRAYSVTLESAKPSLLGADHYDTSDTPNPINGSGTT